MIVPYGVSRWYGPVPKEVHQIVASEVLLVPTLPEFDPSQWDRWKSYLAPNAPQYAKYFSQMHRE